GRWWVRPALAVPVVGQQLRAVRTLSAAGEDLAGAASTASSELDLKGLRLQHGAVDLAAVERADGALASARRALDRAATNVESAKSPWLVAPLVKAIGDFDRRMADARRDVGTAADVLDLAGPMLGRDGPRRWFLAVVTPAENRGSGGLVGNLGEITAEAGKLDLTAVARVALDGDARENFLGEVIGAVWERATTGDLPSPASLARAMAPAVRGRHIQLHSRRAEEQAALGRLGADGALRHSGGDHLGLVTDN